MNARSIVPADWRQALPTPAEATVLGPAIARIIERHIPTPGLRAEGLRLFPCAEWPAILRVRDRRAEAPGVVGHHRGVQSAVKGNPGSLSRVADALFRLAVQRSARTEGEVNAGEAIRCPVCDRPYLVVRRPGRSRPSIKISHRDKCALSSVDDLAMRKSVLAIAAAGAFREGAGLAGAIDG